ncbi:HN1_G0037170.mRNA.1.CDS.1 [Saccharomyces cerevisiae]|nr:HN1_G0037170.mRNA.1.CDS.1 [Saccharomyces cerevisiae]CAI4737381.1 BAL_1a_G0048080.mRNA.1.CDS.1 [Saccharomyces cerevisiae]CAI7327521.1 BAL_1a_G0048080.mRNA.1.CDS.1 [Saccharomyces cerevisiae]
MGDELHNRLLHQNDGTKDAILYKIIESLVCSICHDYMFVPMMTPCGHNYCYGCLNTWFASNTQKELACPQCRSDITTIPALNTTLQQYLSFILEKLRDQNDESFKKLLTTKTKEENDYKNDKEKDTLFDKVFKNSALAVADDSDDGITRCSNCHWELDPDEVEDGNVCPHCNARIRNYAGGRDEFDEEEYSEGELDEIRESMRRRREDRFASTNPFANRDDVSSEEDDSSEEEPMREHIPLGRWARSHNRSIAVDAVDDEDDEEEDEEEEEEMDSDLKDFIEDDEDNEDEDGSRRNLVLSALKNRHVIITDDEEEEQQRHATEEEDRDSDFYEHNDDGFVSGDSLDEDQKEVTQIQSSSDSEDRSLSYSGSSGVKDNNDDNTEELNDPQPKRQKRFRVVLGDSDDE